MDRQRHECIQRIFDACSDLLPDEQTARLAELCAGDADLQAKVAHLLDLDANPEMRIRPVEIWAQAAEDSLPDRIGGYRILERLGQGGMGIVYLAEQENPRRPVALKVLRGDLLSDESRRRFVQEAEVLGRLRHPGIAGIHEAGAAADGQLFFAMEYVEGESLTDHVVRRGLGTREVLALVASVCDAVEHAHRNGVIHRDLKPHNILVGADGRPRVLDFGIARVADADFRTVSLRTDVAQLMGTIPYMSPEQVSGRSSELDARSDVYALGVITFELLSGEYPLPVAERSLPEATRVIREDDPRRLSSFVPRLRGDVETMVARALEKEPARRYASAAAFASDLRRYLADEPIVARPASMGYQLAKFARRHRGLVAGVAAAFVAVVAGLAVSLGLYFEAEGARRAERAEAERANAINSFLLDDLLAAPDPWSARGRDVTVAEVVTGAVGRLEGRFPGQPGVEAQVRRTLAATYASLGLYAEAAAQDSAAYVLAGGDDRAPSLAFARELAVSADLLKRDGDVAAARARIDRSFAVFAALGGGAGVEHVHALRTRADIEAAEGDYEAGDATYAAALAELQRAAPDDREEMAAVLGEWGSLLFSATRHPEALVKKREALAIQRDLHGDRSPQVAVLLSDIAAIHVDIDSLDVALQEYERARGILSNALGGNHPETLTCAMNLGNALRRAGRRDEAEALLAETYEATRTALGPDHPQTLMALNNLAILHLDARDGAQARPLYAELVATASRTLGPDHDETLRYRTNLAWCERYLGDMEAATAGFRAVFEAYEGRYGIGNLNTLIAGHGLAIILRDTGDTEAAIGVYRRIVGGCRDLREECGFRWGRYLFELGQLLAANERYAEAAAAFGEGWDACVGTWGEADWRSSQVEYELGQALVHAGDAAGVDHLLASYDRLRESDRVSPDYKQGIYARLAEGLGAVGQGDRMAAIETP